MEHLHIQPNKQIALMLAKRSLAELVYDAVNLEGINFTLPEVQTLLDGVTVGGHKLHDQEITLNQSKAWKKIFADVESNRFEITKDYLIALHDIAGRNEALEWGCFRTGGVTIAGTDYLPPKASELDACFNLMLTEANAIKDIFKQSIFIFLEMARYQFFYDVNKRMGRFIMNGNLLQHGYPVINVPVKRQLEFNEKMLNFYHSHNHQEMTVFMLSCLDDKVIKIMEA
ncbi:Fic family protein [Fangia hongkongensis]|uniref:Fic family protein n=2 Tax=Fangia hongkongensis TaxID=270495 RepID=UPI0003790974|nr:Fic family protein [Fangia hongkongensis]